MDRHRCPSLDSHLAMSSVPEGPSDRRQATCWLACSHWRSSRTPSRGLRLLDWYRESQDITDLGLGPAHSTLNIFVTKFLVPKLTPQACSEAAESSHPGTEGQRLGWGGVIMLSPTGPALHAMVRQQNCVFPAPWLGLGEDEDETV